MKYLKKFSTNTERATYEGSDDYIEPYVSLVSEDSSVHYNSWADEYFTTVAREDGTISFNIWRSMGTDMITSISYSTDNGTTWTTTANQDNKSEHLTITVNVNEGDVILWKGIASQLGYWDNDDLSDSVGSFFSSDCEFDAKGNVMSLLYGDNFKNQTTIEEDYAFSCLFSDFDGQLECGIVNAKDLILPVTTLAGGYYYMFYGCTSLTTAPDLSATTLADSCYSGMFNKCTSLTTAPELPATTLADSCYSSMFQDCTSLTTAPELPATTLAYGCYSSMFGGCTSLTTAPELPADTLANNCYSNMFRNCTSLTTAPELPATTLANYCYYYMFYGCTSLTTPPELPATTLENHCYSNMFYDCTSLETAPELPATTLANYCYYYMFYGCTNLNYIKAMFTTTPSGSSPNYYTQNWVSGVAANGTFVKNSAATWNVTGNNGIPSGWTIQTYNPYVEEYFTTIARENGTISFNIRFDMGTNYITSISYSTDNGETWNTTNNVDNKSEHLVIDVSVERGDKILWKGTATQFGCWSSDEEIDDIVGSSFSSTCEIDVQGNVMSLLYGDNFKNKTVFENEYTFTYLFSDYDRGTGCLIVNAQNLLLPATTLTYGCYSSMFRYCSNLITVPELPATILAEFCYQYMFDGCTSLTTAPELHATQLVQNCYYHMFYGCTSLITVPKLPATELANHCYSNMFYGCTSLTVAPELPATTLAENCYWLMFGGCTSLTKAPELPATILANSCYSSMFSACTSLIIPPELPATTLANYCYLNMFYNCTSLTKAPELPATTLANNCYSYMFYGCTRLTTAPELPATTLAENCYSSMFRDCTNLNYIKAMFTTTPSDTYTLNWVKGVASSGTFIKNPAATWNVTGVNGVPTGWTVQTYNPYVNEYFTTIARENGTISFNIWKNMGTEYITSMSYSTDNGETWVTTPNQNNKTVHLSIDVNVNDGDKVMWKGSARKFGYLDEDEYGDYVGSFFSSTCEFDAQGNVMSLLYGDNFHNVTQLSQGIEFCRLFSDSDSETNCKIVNAKDLSLPATTLAENCYYSMFAGCTSLITAPELPATTLANYCYLNMFWGCTSLTTAPELPATTLASNCYNGMFVSCTSLVNAPELPATTLTRQCYYCMFYNCRNLINAPELPATTLATDCYSSMFYGCTNLNYIKAMFTTTPSTTYTQNWVRNVASSGTFVKNSAAQWNVTGVHGVPTGWTVQTATE